MSDAPVLGGIHRMEDFDSADDFIKKHTPHIDCRREGGECIVDVAVGYYVPHPNMPDHFFENIELLADGTAVARFDFSAVAANPKVTASLVLDPGTKLEARASCNLHGVWAAAITV